MLIIPSAFFMSCKQQQQMCMRVCVGVYEYVCVVVCVVVCVYACVCMRAYVCLCVYCVRAYARVCLCLCVCFTSSSVTHLLSQSE